jgi:hypothetical protein
MREGVVHKVTTGARGVKKLGIYGVEDIGGKYA